MEKAVLNIDDISVEQLEEIMAKKKEEARKRTEKERIAYEKKKEDLISAQISQAIDLHLDLIKFKKTSTDQLNNHYEEMKKYGDVNNGNKGSFTVQNQEQTMKVEYKRNTKFGYDERGDIAAELVMQWLKETSVKKSKRDKHELIISLLSKTSDGKYDPRNIAKLYQWENAAGDYQHELFQKAILMFKESYVSQGSSYYIRFWKLDAEGRWENINLNWSSI